MILRQYQRDIRSAVFREWQEVQSTLVDAATGTGKTETFISVILQAFPRRAIVINNRTNLVLQTAARIRKATGLSVEIEMGEYKSRSTADLLSEKPQVICSSVQTLTAGGDGAGRIGKFDPFDFGICIYDECHGAVSPSGKRVVNYFKQNPDLKILGVTATPDRFDEEALGHIFETCAYQYPIYDPEHLRPNAIDDGWLVPIHQHPIAISELDFSKVRTTAGDLNGSDLAAILEAEKPLQKMTMAMFELSWELEVNSLYEIPTEQWASFARQHGHAKRALCFTRSVKHAELISGILNRVLPGMSAWVCGETPDDERIKIDADFKCGKIQFLANCNTHGEGFDCPEIDLIFLAAPTKSRARYAQWIGRGTRPLPGLVDDYESAGDRRTIIAASRKPFCTVVDFVGNAGKHKLISCMDVLGGTVSDEIVERAIEHAKKSSMPVDVAEILEEEIKAEKERKLQEDARKARLVGRAKYSMSTVDPFDVFQITPSVSRGWDLGKVISPKMAKILSDNGINSEKLPYSQAKQLVGEIIHRYENGECRFKQARLLRKYGYNPHMKFEEAKTTIDALAKNGWRKPVQLDMVENPF